MKDRNPNVSIPNLLRLSKPQISDIKPLQDIGISAIDYFVNQQLGLLSKLQFDQISCGWPVLSRLLVDFVIMSSIRCYCIIRLDFELCAGCCSRSKFDEHPAISCSALAFSSE